MELTEERTVTSGDGGAPEEDALLLGVRGYACEVFDDPAVAWALHQETHLIPWRGDASGLLVDRFDARNLLDDRAQFRQLKKQTNKRKFGSISGISGQSDGGSGGADDGDVGGSSELSALLHRLRYGDYAVEFPGEQVHVSTAENRFPYQYPEDSAAGDGEEEEEEEEEADGDAFTPTFRVPDGVQVPKTLKRHAIVKATADKARGNAQLEVMMKMRLGDNAKFAFLRPASCLHAYYCFLRDENPQEGTLKAAASAGFLLLGAEYEDSDDEDTDPPSSQAKSIDAPSSK